MTALPVIAELLRQPQPEGARLVFDIDNTVADTRYRTLHVAREFDGHVVWRLLPPRPAS